MTNDQILLLLTRKQADTDALESALAARLPTGARMASILPADALPGLAHADGLAPGLPDVLVTLPASATAEIVAATDGMFNREASALLAFRRHAVLPGSDAIRLYFGLRRLPHLSLEGFHDYWLNKHADIGRKLIPPYTYHQLHADPAATAHWAETVGIPASTLDGVVEVHFPDVDAFVRQLSREDVASEALADERNFIDHSRSQFWAYRERA
ncbi:MAG: EthD domain-containing protein [Novosphingobium sp.]